MSSTRTPQPFLPRRSRRCRARARGAIILEAAIVISMLTLGLMGLMFFRTYYIRELTAARLARGAILAHSMVGCEGLHPRDWIGQKDLRQLTANNPNSNSQPAQGQNQSSSTTSSDGFAG